jgi:hypothetical protein
VSEAVEFNVLKMQREQDLKETMGILEVVKIRYPILSINMDIAINAVKEKLERSEKQ